MKRLEEALSRREFRKPTLIAIHEEAVQHVTYIDKKLSAPHALDEIVRPLHFGQELDEEQGSTLIV